MEQSRSVHRELSDSERALDDAVDPLPFSDEERPLVRTVRGAFLLIHRFLSGKYPWGGVRPGLSKVGDDRGCLDIFGET